MSVVDVSWQTWQTGRPPTVSLFWSLIGKEAFQRRQVLSSGSIGKLSSVKGLELILKTGKYKQAEKQHYFDILMLCKDPYLIGRTVLYYI